MICRDFTESRGASRIIRGIMASDPGAAGTQAAPMIMYRLYWVSGGTTGEIVDFAPDADTLEATVRAHPSRFGIPCQSMILGRPRRLVAREEIGERAA